MLGQAAAANPIDLFVAKRLAKTGLKLAGQASKRELARRIYFALIGLPPLPEEVATFVADARPDAYEQLVIDCWLLLPMVSVGHDIGSILLATTTR